MSTTISSSSIVQRFAELQSSGRRALVAYLTAGFPDPSRSVECLHALDEGGADIIELGVPFSDPIADGPVIQAASQRSLEQGTTFDTVLELCTRASLKAPVVLFTYLNPVIAAGPDALTRAADAGVSGILVTDLPLGSDLPRETELAEGPLDFIRLVAPTTPRERMAEIARSGSGFVYLISRLGVTGPGGRASASLGETILRLRSVTTLPICVGFGIHTPRQAKDVAAMADGVVVGSAMVSAAEKSPEAVLRLTREMRAALDE